jgi:hypothetical protein
MDCSAGVMMKRKTIPLLVDKQKAMYNFSDENRRDSEMRKITESCE